MGFTDYLSIINSAITLIAIVVGIISFCKLNNKIINKSVKNSVTKADNSSVQQAYSIINNGINEFSVREITKNELIEITNKINSLPRIYTGSTPPTDSKDGDIWFKPIA